MSVPGSLKDVYLDAMKDLWSANDQMTRAVQQLSDQASEPKPKQRLQDAVGGIGQHTALLKSLIEVNGGTTSPEPCKGMEGLVTEALKHGLKEAPSDGRLRDVQIIAQYQRMSHYGLAGFGATAAYAKALGKTDQESKLKTAVSEIYKGDDFASQPAGESVARAAA
ncbi:ferritin-like domain-containing protein [Methylorubrum zatmanii]